MLNGTSYTWDDEEQEIITVYVTVVTRSPRATHTTPSAALQRFIIIIIKTFNVA